MLVILTFGLPAVVAVALWLLGAGKRWSPLVAAFALATMQVVVGYTHEPNKSSAIGLLATWFLFPPLLAGLGAFMPRLASTRRRALLFFGLYVTSALLLPPLTLWLGLWSK